MVPGVSCCSDSGLQQNESECTCKFSLVLACSFHLCSGTKETESRKGEEEKRRTEKSNQLKTLAYTVPTWHCFMLCVDYWQNVSEHTSEADKMQ